MSQGVVQEGQHLHPGELGCVSARHGQADRCSVGLSKFHVGGMMGEETSHGQTQGALHPRPASGWRESRTAFDLTDLLDGLKKTLTERG